MTSEIEARLVRVGDHILYDGRRYTVAVSEPCDLNDGWWHLESEEPDPESNGWPWSLRCLPGRPTTIERSEP